MEASRLALTSRDRNFFLACVGISLVVHMIMVFLAMPSSKKVTTTASGEEVRDELIAERFAAAVNRAVPLDSSSINDLERLVAKYNSGDWSRVDLPETLMKAATKMGLTLHKAEVIRSLDPTHSRQGRWDVFVEMQWEEGRDASDMLILALLVGEATLKSDFGSHRLWVRLLAEDGEGRVALETMDARYYRNGKRVASDLLYNAVWVSD